MSGYRIGIPDERFIRGKVPITKEEIRVVTLAKLQLDLDCIFWDVGAGTGSVAIEAALICGRGKVYAIEKNPEAIDLIKKNCTAFGVKNLRIVLGEAPEALKSLPKPNRVFIGGSGPYTQEILEKVVESIKSPGVIVMNSITLETIFSALQFFDSKGLTSEIVCVNISTAKAAGSKRMMVAKNPVYILRVHL